MKTGVIKTSQKENERRLPIHPSHIGLIDANIRKSLFFEEGYGSDYKVLDKDIISMGSHIESRDKLISDSDAVILPKPTLNDLNELKYGAIVWGWTHCVQNADIAQVAIDKKLTYMSWEAMHTWKNGEHDVHIFYRNNELAGYAAIIHALQLMGMDGLYGDRKKVVVLGYGSVSKGAIIALHGRGFNNITVLSKREFHLIGHKDPDVYFRSYILSHDKIRVNDLYGKSDFMDFVSDADIIVNGVLQNVSNPVTFIWNKDLTRLKPGCLIIDVSCDKAMGFEFAQPTTFDDPMFEVGDVYYYSVDHAPSYLWRAATREISFGVLPYINDVTQGLERIFQNETLARAIEIQNGDIINKDIIEFQRRSTEHPYHIKGAT